VVNICTDMPATVQPMEPVLAAKPFDRQDYLYQVKWDGVRMVAFVANGVVRLQNRHYRDRTQQYPELTALAGLLGERSAILDGEIVAFREGKPHFPAVLQREQRRIAGEIPICYFVFDLLWLDGWDWRPKPLEDRQEQLTALFEGTALVQQVESHPSGQALFAAVGRLGWEGIVAKKRHSPYLGGKSRHWLKIKHWQERCFVIGGYLTSDGRLRSLLLGLYEWDGRLRYVGKAGSGLRVSETVALLACLEPIGQPATPFQTGTWPRNGHWVEPVLTVTVQFQEWTDSLTLRSPVVKGPGQVLASECRL